MISGESVDATGHKPHEAGNPAGWCRFSNTCYMVGKPRRCVMCGAEFMSTNVLRRTCSQSCACKYGKLKTREKEKLNQLWRDGKR